MERKIKLAKELVKVAKSLVAQQGGSMYVECSVSGDKAEFSYIAVSHERKHSGDSVSESDMRYYLERSKGIRGLWQRNLDNALKKSKNVVDIGEISIDLDDKMVLNVFNGSIVYDLNKCGMDVDECKKEISDTLGNKFGIKVRFKN